MRTLFTLSSGVVLGLFATLLLVRAGFPPALGGLVLWLLAGAVGLTLVQFAFLKGVIRDSQQAARRQPLRAFLVGLLLLLLPLLAASALNLGGARELGALGVLLCFGALSVLFWPAAVSYQIGERLAPECSEPARLTAGTMVAASSLLLPVLGWFWLLYLTALTTGGLYLRTRCARV